MDYGMRLTRHVIAQVLGNLGPAARITFVPYAIIFLVGGFAGFRVIQFGVSLDRGTSIPSFPIIAVLTVLIVVPLAFSWAAVGWHRYVLLEEGGASVVPDWDSGRVLGYLGRVLVITVLILAAFMAIGSLLGFLLASLPDPAIGLTLALGFNLLGSWLFVRMGLILPARAIDEAVRLRRSWRATGPVSGEILVPIIGFAIFFTLVPQALQLLLGSGFLFLVPSVVLFWLQMLVNLALLTTLYGNLIEGRELN